MEQTRRAYDGLPLPHERDEGQQEDDEMFQWPKFVENSQFYSN